MPIRIESLGAGDLKQRVRFENRELVDDGYGNPVSGEWQTQFSRAARIELSKGGEGIIAARLQGTFPTLAIVRYDSLTKTITPEWRMIEVLGDDTEVVYAIHQADDMERRRRWITILCEAGVSV
jgi:SPP1 family predicted phage head-tail adaptor